MAAPGRDGRRLSCAPASRRTVAVSRCGARRGTRLTSATDPSVAPKGCDAFYVLAPVPNLDGETDWHTAADPYRKRIAAHLEKTLLPGLGDALVTSRVMTPLDFQSRLLAHKGAAFGMEPRLIFTGAFEWRPASSFRTLCSVPSKACATSIRRTT